MERIGRISPLRFAGSITPPLYRFYLGYNAIGGVKLGLTLFAIIISCVSACARLFFAVRAPSGYEALGDGEHVTG